MTSGIQPRLTLDVACHLNVLAADASPETLPATLDAIAAAGYSRVALPPLNPVTTDVGALGSALADRGLTPITSAGGQSASADVSSTDARVRAAGAAALRRFVDFTVSLGGDQLNGLPYGVFGRPDGATSRETFQRSAREVGAVADYANERGVMMTFEVVNRYETSLVNTAAGALEFVAMSGSDHLRIHLDTFHMAIEEADMAEAIRVAVPKLGYLELGQSGRGRISTGVIDLADVVRHAFDVGYRGRIGIEAFSRGIIGEGAGDMLAIWREPFHDGQELALDAMRVIRRGFAQSVEGAGSAEVVAS